MTTPPASPAAPAREASAPSAPAVPAPGAPTDASLATLLRVPGDADHKYTRGVVEVWAGSGTYPGAAVLACSAAVRAGAGMVRLAAPRRVEDIVLAARPEVVPAPGRHQALVIGPGTDPADEPRAAGLRQALRHALTDAVPAVVDAGALPLLPGLLADAGPCGPTHVLTPHAGEAAALLTALGQEASRAEVEARPGAAATALARLTGATVVLKGSPTLVASPPAAVPADGGPAGPAGPGAVPWALGAGPGWLATAGSGDVLAGVLGALLGSTAAGAPADGAAHPTRPALPAARVAALAVRVHALAGEAASHAATEPPGRPVAALDVAGAVPQAIGHLLAQVRESRP